MNIDNLPKANSLLEIINRLERDIAILDVCGPVYLVNMRFSSKDDARTTYGIECSANLIPGGELDKMRPWLYEILKAQLTMAKLQMAAL